VVFFSARNCKLARSSLCGCSGFCFLPPHKWGPLLHFQGRCRVGCFFFKCGLVWSKVVGLLSTPSYSLLAEVGHFFFFPVLRVAGIDGVFFFFPTLASVWTCPFSYFSNPVSVSIPLFLPRVVLVVAGDTLRIYFPSLFFFHAGHRWSFHLGRRKYTPKPHTFLFCLLLFLSHSAISIRGLWLFSRHLSRPPKTQVLVYPVKTFFLFFFSLHLFRLSAGSLGEQCSPRSNPFPSPLLPRSFFPFLFFDWFVFSAFSGRLLHDLADAPWDRCPAASLSLAGGALPTLCVQIC